MRCSSKFAAAVALAMLALLTSARANDVEPAAPTPKPARDGDDPLAGMDDPHTLSQLLQWSLAHQDLDELHKKAEDIRQGRAPASATGDDGVTGTELPTPNDPGRGPTVSKKPLTEERRAELEELSKQLMPDTVALMLDALAVATDASLPLEEREAGLLDLQELAEDIDNARDLKSIGGYPEVVALLASEEPPLQAAAAWVLGSAVKNHRELQLHLLSERALPSLLVLVQSHASAEVRGKALYAASALLRNCPEAQLAFGEAGGLSTLSAVLAEGDVKLARKALALVTDLLRELRYARGEEMLDPADAPMEAVVEGSGATTITTSGGATGGEGGEGGGGVAAAATTIAAGEQMWQQSNATELCGAVVDCLRRADDLDAQEKALQALEQLVGAGLLARVATDGGGGGASPSATSIASSACEVGGIRAALGGYRERCAALLKAAAEAGGGTARGATTTTATTTQRWALGRARSCCRRRPGWMRHCVP